MRKFFSSALILLFVAFVFNAQAQTNTKAPYPKGQVATTLDVYRYITAGLSEDVGKGKDIKTGYVLSDILSRDLTSSIGNGKLTVMVVALIQKSSQKVAGWCVLYKDSEKQLKVLCIPTGTTSPEIWNYYFSDMASLSLEAHQAVNWGMAHLIGLLSNDDPNKKPSGLGAIGKK